MELTVPDEMDPCARWEEVDAGPLLPYPPPQAEAASVIATSTAAAGKLLISRKIRRRSVRRHGSTIPNPSTSVKKARAKGEASLRARTSSQSICSRSARA